MRPLVLYSALSLPAPHRLGRARSPRVAARGRPTTQRRPRASAGRSPRHHTDDTQTRDSQLASPTPRPSRASQSPRNARASPRGGLYDPPSAGGRVGAQRIRLAGGARRTRGESVRDDGPIATALCSRREAFSTAETDGRREQRRPSMPRGGGVLPPPPSRLRYVRGLLQPPRHLHVA